MHSFKHFIYFQKNACLMLAVSATGLATSTAMFAMSFAIASHLIGYNIHQEKKITLNVFNNSFIHAFFLNSIDPFGGNVIADNVNRIFCHDDVFRFHFVNLCNGARVFVFALHKQFVLILTYSNNNRFVQ